MRLLLDTGLLRGVPVLQFPSQHLLAEAASGGVPSPGPTGLSVSPSPWR